MTGNEAKQSDVMTMHKLFEHLQVHEMHTKNEGLFIKGKHKRRNLVDKADHKKNKIITRLPAQVKCVARVICLVTTLENFVCTKMTT